MFFFAELWEKFASRLERRYFGRYSEMWLGSISRHWNHQRKQSREQICCQIHALAVQCAFHDTNWVFNSLLLFFYSQKYLITFFFWIFSVREYTDFVGHVRVLSWILLGSLTHTASVSSAANNNHIHGPPIPLAQPIPLEVSCNVADHVQVILSGYPEQSKTSLSHMSSLLHVFILCQVKWLRRNFLRLKNNFEQN